MTDRERRQREREQRREERELKKRQNEEQVRREEEAYRAMMEEEHRHEERLHRKKERALDREKRNEDRRRKKWEEYEKCLEREAEQSEDLNCVEPDFATTTTKRHTHRRRHASVEPEETETLEGGDSREDVWTEDYDYEAPFNGEEHQTA